LYLICLKSPANSYCMINLLEAWLRSRASKRTSAPQTPQTSYYSCFQEMLRDTFDNDTVRKGCPDNNAVSKGVARFDTTDGEDKDSTLQEELKPVTQSAGLLQDEAFLCAYCNAALETKKYSSIGCQLTGSLTNNSPDKCELCLLFSRARVAEDGDQKDNHLGKKPNADLGSDANSEGAESLEELDELESDSELSGM